VPVGSTFGGEKFSALMATIWSITSHSWQLVMEVSKKFDQKSKFRVKSERDQGVEDVEGMHAKRC
jgi:hypothetical protein